MGASVNRVPIRKCDALIAYLDELCFPYGERFIPELNDLCWLVSNSDPVGYLTLSNKTYSDCLYLTRYGVIPNEQGKGLGKDLLKASAAYVRRYMKDKAYLLTYTTKENRPSISALESVGYRFYRADDYLHWYLKL